jgi:hypothetical protein
VAVLALETSEEAEWWRRGFDFAVAVRKRSGAKRRRTTCLKSAIDFVADGAENAGYREALGVAL